MKDLLKYFHDSIQTVEDVEQLKKKILELAVRGKLVKQDPNDEPASILLERIQEEKERLIKEKKIKRTKPLPRITPGEIPYELPEGWEWIRCGDISINIHYGYTASALDKDTGVKFLRISDIQDSKVFWDTVPFCEIDQKNLEKNKLHTHDILIARTGGTIGKSYIISRVEGQAVFASYLIRMIPSEQINAQYVKYFLETNLYWEQLKEKSQGTGQPNVNATSLSQLKLPLPSFEEQKRIVSKVDELLVLCSQLEHQIEQSESNRKQLMQSVLKAALAKDK